MYSPHHCPSTIKWIFCIATAYHTPTSSFLDGPILRIGTATIWLATCVPIGVHWPLILILFSPLKLNTTLDYDKHKDPPKFPMSHLTTTDSLTKLYLDFSSGDTINLKIREIGHRSIPSGYLSNSHVLLPFLVPLHFLPLRIHLLEEATPPFQPCINLS